MCYAKATKKGLTRSIRQRNILRNSKTSVDQSNTLWKGTLVFNDIDLSKKFFVREKFNVAVDMVYYGLETAFEIIPNPN